MSADQSVIEALKTLPAKNMMAGSTADKKRYSELMSHEIAQVLASEMRKLGMTTARPDSAGGSERRMAGGIGAKKVDVTWATEESGLLFAASVKTINWQSRSGQFQKNLTNRRGDMLFESVTLHRKFPDAVLFGFFVLDREAMKDATTKRSSTFENAHKRLKIFSGRQKRTDPDEQFERLLVCLVDATPGSESFECYVAGEPMVAVSLETILDEALHLVADRNADFYEVQDGCLRAVR